MEEGENKVEKYHQLAEKEIKHLYQLGVFGYKQQKQAKLKIC